ncbi:MAG: DUF2628 domain-containing protein [Hyphomicrobiales bacterium]|nr:DUF2628 domain-containing protein [Hyphomicrobiales bacterium]
MAVYTVHEPAGLKGRSDAAARRIAFVKEGFCWPAFLIPPVWLVYRRMWWVLLGFLAIGVALGGLELWLGRDSGLSSIVEFALLLLFALEANNLRRWQLRRRGYRMRAVVAGRDREQCERQFFADWLAEAPAPSPDAAREIAPPAIAPAHAPSGVIGMFPEPGDR